MHRLGELLRVKITATSYAGVAELADALDSGSSGGNFVEVQVLLPAPQKKERPIRGVLFLWHGLRAHEPCGVQKL